MACTSLTGAPVAALAVSLGLLGLLGCDGEQDPADAGAVDSGLTTEPGVLELCDEIPYGSDVRTSTEFTARPWDRVPNDLGDDDVARLLTECREHDERCRDRALYDRVEVYAIRFGVTYCLSGTLASESAGECYVAMDGDEVVAKWSPCYN